MISLRHFLHPIRSTKSLYRRTNDYSYRKLTEHGMRKMLRDRREKCWCGGELCIFKWHRAYGICINCGCYVNRNPPHLEELRQFYSLDKYWKKWMTLKRAPTIEERTTNDLNDGRVAYWLSLIQSYGPRSGEVIEVGCGPGVLLQELKKRGYVCTGIEISEDVFPNIQLPKCDVFLAFDVLEHISEPFEFLQKARTLLRPGGVAILQQPTIRIESGYNLAPPFGKDFKRMFDDVEHLWIFTTASLNLLAKRTGFHVIDDKSVWRQCHEILVLA
jgi:SAM-dependent methyltransferase